MKDKACAQYAFAPRRALKQTLSRLADSLRHKGSLGLGNLGDAWGTLYFHIPPSFLPPFFLFLLLFPLSSLSFFSHSPRFPLLLFCLDLLDLIFLFVVFSFYSSFLSFIFSLFFFAALCSLFPKGFWAYYVLRAFKKTYFLR